MSLFLEIAQKVLKEVNQPMTAKGIWKYAKDNGYIPDNLPGKTPFQTLKSKVSVHIRRYGDASPFVRTAPGKFYLRDLLEPNRKLYRAMPLQPPGAVERVLVFPTSLLDKLGRFQGIHRNCEKLYNRILRSKACGYLPRLQAESTDDHKQIVTYTLITWGKKLLAFRRGNYTRTDEFLRGSHCVGFGGHVIEGDSTFFNQADLGVRDSAAREIAEEIELPLADRQGLTADPGLQLIGALNDDSSDVGRRHLAFLFRYDIKPSADWKHPKKGEKAVIDLRWIDPSHNNFEVREFEYWSQLCLREFYPASLRVQPSYLITQRTQLIPPHVLCVLGSVGSGKTEATTVFKNDYHYHEVNSGRVLAEIMGIPPVPDTPRKIFSAKAAEFIATDSGPKTLAEALWQRVSNESSALILVDGIRNVSTLKHFRHLAHEKRLALVYVHTPPDIAYRFYKRRMKSAVSVQEFLELRESPVEREVREMIADADAVLYNWTGRQQYRNTIHTMMQDLGIGKHK